MRNLTSPVLPSLMFFAALFAEVLPGCSSRTNGFVSMGGDTRGSASVSGAGGRSTMGGASGVQSSPQSAGTGPALGGANAGGGAANTGGKSSRPIHSTGGTTVIGTAVCDTPNICGKVLDGKEDVIDCGFDNCPQEICGISDPNRCPPVCSAKIDCKSAGNRVCGVISDGCGGLVDCGFGNCPKEVCGKDAPSQCPASCAAKIDCRSAGNKNCGFISDGCGGVVGCGTCTDPQCCGCGNSGSPGVPNVCGGGSKDGSGLKQTCLAGTQGCLCDTRGGCAPGLACNTAKTPNVCCSGSNCEPLRTNIGATCSGTGTATCTPGITIPSATGSNDNCGYPASSFNESVFMCAIFAQGGGPVPAQIQAFMNDEYAMTLGCETTANPVSAMPANPGAVYYPKVGDPTCVDTVNRPMRPSLYITDITADPNCRAGDQQQGGEPYDPIAVFGTWKAAVGNTPGTNPTSLNYWNLGTGADSVPADAISACPCVEGSCATTGHEGRGYGVETRYEAALLGGHSYRFQVIAHDGDQTRGADSGEACVVFCAEGDLACQPTTCETCGKSGDGCDGQIDCGPCCVKQTCGPGMCGKSGDGCGGQIDCGPCCTPWTCDDYCPGDNSGNIRECSSTKDDLTGPHPTYILDCAKPDGCYGTLNCYCPIG